MIILCSPPLTRRSHRNQRDGGRPRGGHYGDQVGHVLMIVMIIIMMAGQGAVTMETRWVLC